MLFPMPGLLLIIKVLRTPGPNYCYFFEWVFSVKNIVQNVKLMAKICNFICSHLKTVFPQGAMFKLG